MVGNINTANVNATNVNANSIILGSTTAISCGTATTTSTTTSQTIVTVPVGGITGVEFLVKSTDTNGVLNKYSMCGIHAVTDGNSTCDWSTFGSVALGGSTGTFSVVVAGGNLKLQVNPSSSNSTVWTTQYRYL